MTSSSIIAVAAAGPLSAAMRRTAAAALLGAAMMLGAGSEPASAADPSAWQAGCSYRTPSGIPGQGQSMLLETCGRMRACQAMADQGKPNMAIAGCFDYQPSSRGKAETPG